MTDSGCTIERFDEGHAGELAELCHSEGWDSWEDPVAVASAMLAPGVTALVALKEGGLVGAVQVLGDGQINWVIGTLIVAPSYRSQGIGRRLIAESFIATGAKRLDLLTENDGPAFYRQLPGREMAGFRLYPQNP